MKKIRTKIVISMVSCLVMGSTAISAAPSNSITYKNQRGSTLTLTWNSEQANAGSLTGSFITAVGNCKAAIGQPVPVTGYYNGNAIALIVNYPACNSVVAMTGNFNRNNDELKTIWLVARKADDPVQANWDANTIGSDTFNKQTT